MISSDDKPTGSPLIPRLFLFEPGWQVARKADSIREFCYTMVPGVDYYHRLLDGEVYVFRADEKLCLPCAARRGLLSYEPRSLREPLAGMNQAIESALEAFDIVVRETEEIE